MQAVRAFPANTFGGCHRCVSPSRLRIRPESQRLRRVRSVSHVGTPSLERSPLYIPNRSHGKRRAIGPRGPSCPPSSLDIGYVLDLANRGGTEALPIPIVRVEASVASGGVLDGVTNGGTGSILDALVVGLRVAFDLVVCLSDDADDCACAGGHNHI